MENWIKTKFLEFKTCTADLAKATCQFILKIILPKYDNIPSNVSNNQDFRANIADLILVVLNILRLSQADLDFYDFRALCNCMSILNQENRTEEARDIYSSLQANMRKENLVMFMIVKLSLTMSDGGSTSQHNQHVGLLKEIVQNSSEEIHFELLFGVLLECRGNEYVESTFTSVLNKYEGRLEDEKWSVRCGFVKAAIGKNRPELIISG